MILHTAWAMMLIYCRYQPVTAQMNLTFQGDSRTDRFIKCFKPRRKYMYHLYCFFSLSLLFHRAFHIYLLICTNECIIFWLNIIQISVFYINTRAPTCFDPLRSSSGSSEFTTRHFRELRVHYQTRHEPHTQLRYAATIPTIEACNFIDFIII